MEKWIAVGVQLALILLLLILSAVFFRGKGAFLIAGYNTAGPAERAKYDEKALCRFMGKLTLALAGCFGLVALGTGTERMALVWAGIALVLALAFGAVLYANTSNRFRRK